MSASITDLAGAYSAAWAMHDADAIVALHSEESVFQVHGLGSAALGLAAVRQLIDDFLALVPDLRFQGKRMYLGADHIVSEYVMSGTAGGSAFACDGVDVIAVADGRVNRKDTYLDLAALQRQIGAFPEMRATDSTPLG
jgi:ketosteroid isomerase-like protein